MAKASNDETGIPQGYQTSGSKEGPLSALLQIVIGAAIVGGALYWYMGYVGEKKRIADLVTEAQSAQKGDDAPALLAAKRKYEETGKVEEDDRVLVNMAELTAQLYQAYGMADMLAEAQRYVGLAEDRDLKKAERYAAAGYLAIGQGQPQIAESVITDLTDKGVRHAKLLHVLAVAKLAQGKAREAQVAAEEAMKLSTGLVRLPIAHGDALLAQGNFESATNAYSKALKLNPAHLKARTAIVLVQARSREGKPKLLHKEIKKLLRDASTINDGSPPPRVKAFIEYTEGEIFLSEGKAKESLAQAEAALKSDPKLEEAYSLKARGLARLGKIDEAKAAFDEALQQMPTSIPFAEAAFKVMQRHDRTEEGVAFLQRVQQANPDNPHVYPPLAVAQARADMAKEATASAETAIEKLGNADPDAVFARAWAHQASGELDEAREKYNEVIQAKGPQNAPEVFAGMGWVRFREKEYDGAAALFKEAVKQWERYRAPLDTIADGYDAIGKAYDAKGGRRGKKAAEAFYDKAKEVRRGDL